jgi:hypothetical protein
MLLRLIASVGLVALGYYVGKQVGRMEPVREELAKAREFQLADSGSEDDAGTILEHRGETDT